MVMLQGAVAAAAATVIRQGVVRTVTEPTRLLPAGQGIAITRVFEASPADVWREWTEPAAFADWFGGPDYPVPLDTVSMDVRVGGAWRLAMVDDVRRRRIDWQGEYLEVTEPTRLVFTITDQPDDSFHDSVVVELIDLGDGRTEMRFEQRGGGLTPDQYLRAGRGWVGFFDRMAERLAGRARS
jgi:uncharacterized protein YndB with AHSA1/START domain